jgi:hypothetical protein
MIQMAPAKAKLDRYFEMINRRVPVKVSRFIRLLRKPSSFPVRLLVALLLIAGGFFSFLPVLGLWMLPLGLLFIAQDLPFLQQPLANALEWIEAKWNRLRAAWRQMRRSRRAEHSHSDESHSTPQRGCRQRANGTQRVEETNMIDCRDKRGHGPA